MVEVVVRVHDVADRLAGNQLLRLVDNLGGAGFALRAFDDDDVVLEVDGDGRVAAEDEEDALCELFGRHAGRGHARRRRRASRRAASPLRRLNGDRGVGPHLGHAQVEDRVAALPLHDLHRKLHAAEVLVVGVHGFEQRVAEVRGVNPCLNPFNQVLIVDVSIHLALFWPVKVTTLYRLPFSVCDRAVACCSARL